MGALEWARLERLVDRGFASKKGDMVRDMVRDMVPLLQRATIKNLLRGPAVH
jgi:hypothetical protein